MSMSKVTKLAKIVVPASKVASILGWKKNGMILALQLSGDKIDLALADKSHRETFPVETVDCKDMFHGKAYKYINLKQLTRDDAIEAMKCRRAKVEAEFAQRVEEIVSNHEVSAVVANWPVTAEGVRMPKDCGKILRVLDIINTHAPDVLSENRPVTLLEELRDLSVQNSHPTILEDFMGAIWEYEEDGYRTDATSSQLTYA
eukprot:CAMPEP_0113310612 /NCGR_PEP_ID=MMETSP0010_2-20120614/8188_1 /TAXON_ID=216773 ORGANISM="Corethron hystrix, Strain 308" /NCGR_SAMPLE_ID=MMETSP0010_2 /ASSEMBLY_ACC=CAM_ASM_000155 /LENGTH=201 /DNA_ID=CAMNT_0000166103 /DNA_START=114 /DNA_END=719 /DNA_ORIENTATION=+ /assembly_acc=CAM_ASM_000155